MGPPELLLVWALDLELYQEPAWALHLESDLELEVVLALSEQQPAILCRQYYRSLQVPLMVHHGC